jgi:hypothetical protein
VLCHYLLKVVTEHLLRYDANAQLPRSLSPCLTAIRVLQATKTTVSAHRVGHPQADPFCSAAGYGGAWVISNGVIYWWRRVVSLP